MRVVLFGAQIQEDPRHESDRKYNWFQCYIVCEGNVCFSSRETKDPFSLELKEMIVYSEQSIFDSIIK